MTEANNTRSDDLIVNALQTEMRRSMAKCFMAGGSIDSKRPGAWNNYGYKEHLEFEDFYRLWRRNAIANALVARTVNKCWQDYPEMIQGDIEDKDKTSTKWEKAFKAFDKKHDLWESMVEADTYRLVGGCSALILQVADDKEWSESLTTSKNDKRFHKFIPAWKGQLTPTEYDDDQKSLTFGEVKMWSFNELAVGETGVNGRSRQLSIHPDRIILLGDYDTGLSKFEASYNSFVNLEKIEGGSGESFLKNASRQLAINFTKDVDLSAIAMAHNRPVKDIQKIFDQITTNMNLGLDQSILTQGADVKPLVATVPDPKEHHSISLQSACAPFECPSKIVIGNQAGQLASGEDKKEWAETCMGRRTKDLSKIITIVVRHLQKFGFIGATDFAVKWSNLAEASEAEKMERALKMAEINAKNMISGDITYSTEEIRDASGHDNDEPVEKLPEGEPTDDNLDDPDPSKTPVKEPSK